MSAVAAVSSDTDRFDTVELHTETLIFIIIRLQFFTSCANRVNQTFFVLPVTFWFRVLNVLLLMNCWSVTSWCLIPSYRTLSLAHI
jgi:hypothetical protein